MFGDGCSHQGKEMGIVACGGDMIGWGGEKVMEGRKNW